jgi:hypothetical protein
MQFTKKIRIDSDIYTDYAIRIMMRKNGITTVVTSIFLIALTAFLSKAPTLPEALLYGLVAGILFFILASLFQYLITKWMAKKSFVKNQIDQLVTTITMNSEGIEQRFADDTVHFEWKHIDKVLETIGAYYLFYAPSTALILPKKDLSEAEVRSIEQLLQNQLKPHTIKKVGPGHR